MRYAVINSNNSLGAPWHREPASPAAFFQWSMKRRNYIVLAVFPCALVLCSGQSVTATFGLYHWGGAFTRSMHEGVEQIASLGVRNARITLSPRFFSDYNTGSGCYPQFSLSSAA